MQSKEPALYLFKNIARLGSKGTQLLRSASSTFIDVLSDDFAKAQLLRVATKAKTQVGFYIYCFFLIQTSLYSLVNLINLMSTTIIKNMSCICFYLDSYKGF